MGFNILIFNKPLIKIPTNTLSCINNKIPLSQITDIFA